MQDKMERLEPKVMVGKYTIHWFCGPMGFQKKTAKIIDIISLSFDLCSQLAISICVLGGHNLCENYLTTR